MNGKAYTEQECYLEALKLDRTHAPLWRNLGMAGGGTVYGRAYTERECYLEALSWNAFISEFGTPEERNDGRAQETAALIGADEDPGENNLGFANNPLQHVRHLQTSRFMHSGLREDGAALFEQLLAMARNEVPVR